MDDFKAFTQDALPWLYVGGASMIGRLMYHAKQVQEGKRKPLSWALFWDVPIAVGMGWIALGFGKWIGLSWEPTVSLSMACSYIGPYGVDRVFSKVLDWKFGGEKDNGNAANKVLDDTLRGDT